MRNLLTLALCCSLLAAFSCASRNPLPVEPYSPPESSAEPAASLEVPDAAPPQPVAPSGDELGGRECQKLGAALSEDSEVLKDAVRRAEDPKAKAEGFAELATKVQEAGQKATALGLQNRKLKSLASEYSSQMEELANVLRQIGQDRAKKDKPALKKALAELASLRESVARLAVRVDTLCEN